MGGVGMNCGFDREIIQKYADNSIDPLEFIFLKEHINYCGECRRELDIVMTLENELDNYFEKAPETGSLDFLITELVDECISGLNKREKLKHVLSKSIKTGNNIMGNSVKFIKYIPGSKLLGKGIKKTVSAAGNLLVSIVEDKVGKIMANLR